MQSFTKYFRTKVSIILMVVICSIATVSAGGLSGKVSNCYYLSLKNSAGAENLTVKELARGDIVTIIEEKNGWLKVSCNGSTGWVNKKYVTIQSSNANQTNEKGQVNNTSIGNQMNKTVYVNASVLNIRSGYSISYNIIGAARAGEALTALESKLGWIRVRKANGLLGWVSSEYISNNPVKMTVSSVMSCVDSEENTGKGQKIAEYAKTFQGIQYLWAGYSPAGFDCSGYVGYVFNTFANVKLNRTANDMSCQGSNVSRENMRPGDLIYYDTNGGRSYINHVGIYIGEGKMVHASSSKGMVTTTSIETSYWKDALMKIKRIALP